MSDELILPAELPYECAIDSRVLAYGERCSYCLKHPVHVDYYYVRFPNDKSFLEWEKGRGGDPQRANVADSKTNKPGTYCSEDCAKKGYFATYVVWRLKGTK